MSKEFFAFIQIFLGILLTILILLQMKGTGLGSTFGGEIGFYSTRRGVEKMLFYLTISVSALFLAASIIVLLV